jgi:hypothetical protein
MICLLFIEDNVAMTNRQLDLVINPFAASLQRLNDHTPHPIITLRGVSREYEAEIPKSLRTKEP